jgi:hypothetical protein
MLDGLLPDQRNRIMGRGGGTGGSVKTLQGVAEKLKVTSVTSMSGMSSVGVDTMARGRAFQ